MRISDWSSDVCSSDLRGRCRDPLGQPVLDPRADRSAHMTDETGTPANADNGSEDDDARWILYDQDQATKIATPTHNRPNNLTPPTTAIRLRSAPHPQPRTRAEAGQIVAEE